MTWFLVLLFTGLGNVSPVATSMGPFEGPDARAGCFAVAQLAAKDGWKGFCYPAGVVPLNKPEAKAPEPEPKKK